MTLEQVANMPIEEIINLPEFKGMDTYKREGEQDSWFIRLEASVLPDGRFGLFGVTLPNQIFAFYKNK